VTIRWSSRKLVAVHGGELEAGALGGVLHLRDELARELVVATVEEHRHRPHLVGVPGLVDVEDTRRGAALDLVLEARALARDELEIAAGAKLEVLVDEVERAPRRRGRVIGPEVASGVVARAAHHLETGPRVVEAQPERDEVLVVAQLDVEARLVLLDEVVLEDRGFLLARRDDGLEIANRPLQEREKLPLVASPGLEITADPAAEALGLADVEEAAFFVLEEVNAGLGWQALQLLLYGVRQRHSGAI